MEIGKFYRDTFLQAAKERTPEAWDAVLRHKMMLACGVRPAMRGCPRGGLEFWARLIHQHRWDLMMFLLDPAHPHPAHDVHLLCDLSQRSRADFADRIDLLRNKGWWSYRDFGLPSSYRSRLVRYVSKDADWIPNPPRHPRADLRNERVEKWRAENNYKPTPTTEAFRIELFASARTPLIDSRDLPNPLR